MYSIIGWNCSIGVWSRVEGSRCDPNPNEEFAKPDGESLFGNNGKLTPSITILGKKLAQTLVLSVFPLIFHFFLFAMFLFTKYNKLMFQVLCDLFVFSFPGRNVTIPGEVIVLNSIVLPHKDLSQSYKNEIIL